MKSFLSVFTVLFLLNTAVFAQSDEEKKAMAAKDAAAKAEKGWVKGGSLGFNLSGLGLFNPRVGSGGNNFGIGGVGTVFANNKGEKFFWSNKLDLQLAAQNVEIFNTNAATGVTTPRRDFLKNADMLVLNSTFGYSIKGDKLFAAMDALAITNVMKTYQGNALQPINDGDKLIARFLSPLNVSIAPGIAYNPNPHLTLFYSPVAIQYILVADEDIAKQYVHISKDALDDPNDQFFFGFGSRARVGYNNKYYEDRVAVSSNLNLFSNYRKDPQNIDIFWANTIDVQIFKGLSLGLFGNLFYDNDLNVQIDRDNDGFFGETAKFTNNPATLTRDELAPAASMTGGFVLKYSRIF